MRPPAERQRAPAEVRAPRPPVPLTVTDVRQWGYCPRVVYFTYCQPIKRPTTFKMQEGRTRHEEVKALEARRALGSYGLTEGKRHFNVSLGSERLGLAGRVDMLIETEHELIPVEFKNTEARPALNHKYQLAAYALLAEERFGGSVRRCFVHLIPTRANFEVTITSAMRRFVVDGARRMREMIETEAMPEGTRQLGRCRECEFLRFCNDRW